MKGRIAAVFALLLSVLALAQSVHADDHVLFVEQTAHCRVTGERSMKWRSLRLRLSRLDGSYGLCGVTEAETAGAVSNFFTALADTEADTPYESLAVGVVSDYEWLSRHLVETALADDTWSTADGRPRGGQNLNIYVEALLSRPAILGVMIRALRNSRFRATGASCEKTTISGPDTVAFQPDWVTHGARVLFDALCWFALTAK
jgi:hypothetical protein